MVKQNSKYELVKKIMHENEASSCCTYLYNVHAISGSQARCVFEYGTLEMEYEFGHGLDRYRGAININIIYPSWRKILSMRMEHVLYNSDLLSDSLIKTILDALVSIAEEVEHDQNRSG